MGSLPGHLSVFPEIPVVPDIFANGYSDFFILDCENLGSFHWLKISVLIKYIVGREERFSKPLLDFAFMDKCCCVIERTSCFFTIFLCCANENGRVICKFFCNTV